MDIVIFNEYSLAAEGHCLHLLDKHYRGLYSNAAILDLISNLKFYYSIVGSAGEKMHQVAANSLENSQPIRRIGRPSCISKTKDCPHQQSVISIEGFSICARR